MKHGLTLLFQLATVMLGVATLAFMLWEPHVEGRNAHATTFEIYFNDPFLAYVYVGSIPYFIGLYRIFGMFGFMRQHGMVARLNVETLLSVRRCALVLLGFVMGGAVIIFMFGDPDDRPAGFFMSSVFILASSFMAVATSKLAKIIQKNLNLTGHTYH